MPSLLTGTSRLIYQTLGISKWTDLDDRSLQLEPPSDEAALRLVNELYDKLVANYSGQVRSRSGLLWECRQKTRIADHHTGMEKMLEKAVANLAAEGHMPGWFNQCPVASGISDPTADRHRAIDLVHLSDTTARLIELKWASNTPTYALFELLRYGFAYLFARIRRGELGLEDRPFMHVPHVRLEVAGPLTFYAEGTQPALFATMNGALAKLADATTDGAVSMSLHTLSFPAEFQRVPFANGQDVKAECRADPLSDHGRQVRDAFARLAPADTVTGQTAPSDRFLPGVPGDDIERMLDAAPGDEIASGKIDSPESSAALATNTFGFFLHRPEKLPALPGCPHAGWPARSLAIEANVRFPWSGGRHPWLDCLVVTRSALIGIESKRFEPFRDRSSAEFSDAYWRPVWGDGMGGYQGVRDAFRAAPTCTRRSMQRNSSNTPSPCVAKSIAPTRMAD